jgi:hypothetical protein
MSTSTTGTLKSYLQRSLFGFVDRPEFVRAAAIEHFAADGIVLSLDQRAIIDAFVNSPQGKALMRAHLQASWAVFERALDAVLSDDSGHFRRTIDGFIGDIGIFSTSEIPSNQQLWGLYASSGVGFVVAFDPHHEFFRRTSDGIKEANLFRKVRYDSGSIAEFMNNPFYLFLVKNSEWSFEREWRMTKRLSKSDICIRNETGDAVHLFRVERGMIKRIIFGYAYPEMERAMAAEKIRSFDPAVELAHARVNQRTREIEVFPLQM